MQRFGTRRMWQRLMIVGMAIFLVAACSRSQTATSDMGMKDAQDESLAQNMDMDGEDMHDETMNSEDMHGENMAVAHGIPDDAAARENPIPADDASIARGAELFQATCAVCHGPEGQGDGPGAAALNPKPANLSEDHVQGNSDGALFYTISNGVAGTAMVAWSQQYSEEDRWNLVNFLRTLTDHSE